MSLQLLSPFPLDQVSNVWEWNKHTKALTARLGREGFLAEFTRLITTCPSWGVELNGEVVGIVVIEPTVLPGDHAPSDGAAHIAVARKAWGKGVIQHAGQTIIASVFTAIPSLRRLTAWTIKSNYPARAVAEALNFQLEGELRNAIAGTRGAGESLMLYGLVRQEGGI